LRERYDPKFCQALSRLKIFLLRTISRRQLSRFPIWVAFTGSWAQQCVEPIKQTKDCAWKFLAQCNMGFKPQDP